jgi:hypothetical protein
MKTALRLTPLILSALVIAAHFFREANDGFVVFALVVPLLLITRAKWAVVAVQLLLALAAVEWIRTAFAIAHERAAFGAPTTRMFAILGSVALFTALSALPLRKVAAATRGAS